jgi:hypothetical protein
VVTQATAALQQPGNAKDVNAFGEAMQKRSLRVRLVSVNNSHQPVIAITSSIDLTSR